MVRGRRFPKGVPLRVTSQAVYIFASNPHRRVSRFRTVNENIVNYYRPWNASERGGAVRADYTRYAVLVNNTMPGPSITATVNQTVDITVINHLMSDSVAIHWHGIRQVGKRGFCIWWNAQFLYNADLLADASRYLQDCLLT